MAIPERGGPDFTFVGFLILAAVGSFIFKTGPLESSRPTTDRMPQLESETISEVPARLWQDPFKAYHKYRTALQNQPNYPKPQCLSESILQNELLKAGQSSASSLNILGVMISTEMYAETEERRRRRRYAVVSAIATSGFVPRDPSKIYITEVQNIQCNHDLNCKFLLPYEWYKHEDEKTQILVLWLDDSKFRSAPFSLLKQVIGNLLPNSDQPSISSYDKSKISVNIIGPNSSDTLRAFKNDKESISLLKKLPVSSVNILSATATVDDKYLGVKQETTLEKLLTDSNQYESKKASLSFSRTISQDSQITSALAKELHVRRVSCSSHLALISEWDTEYGRTLPKVFQDSWVNECKKEYDQNRIHRFSYFRGIDGQVSDSSSNKQGKDYTVKTSQSAPASTVLDDSSLIRRPHGPAQFDYLRRLAHKIQQEDSKLREQEKRGIGAIGILGSDVFDKLLILRALRPQLPGVVFFTTDLDAHLLHPGDFRWTRNLIIASSYGLSLTEKIKGIDQSGFPPFRENYQTSIFTASLHALNTNFQETNQPIANIIKNPPLKLFEVGRTGAVELPVSDEKTEQSSNQIAPQNNFMLRSLLIAITLLTIGIFLANRLYLVSNLQAVGLEVTVIIVGSFIYLAIVLSVHQEPFSFSNGISVWPTSIFRLIASILAIYFIFTSFVSLKANSDRLTQDYFDENSYPGWIREDLTFSKRFNKFIHYLKTQRYSIQWILTAIIGFVGLVLLFFFSRTIVKGRSIQDIIILVLLWVVPIFFWLYCIRHYLHIKIGRTRLHKLTKNTKRLKKSVSALAYWIQYRELGNTKNRLFRSLTSLYFYMALASILFFWLGSHPMPCRGDESCIWNRVVLILGVFVMLFLLSLVTDAIRLCIYWIRGLTYCDFDWSSARIDKFNNELALPTHLTACWFKLELIAERTQEITRLIYYPFFVIFLMLLARSSYFDNWVFSQPLAIVVSVNLFIAAAGALALRKEAEKARHECIGYLQSELVKLNSSNPQSSNQRDEEFKPAPDQITQLISNIESIRIGAFSPYREQPIVRASLLLLGAVGLSMAEYGMLF